MSDTKLPHQGFGGSYHSLLAEFQRRQNGQGTALDLVKLIVDSFPSFRDEVYLEGRKGQFDIPSLCKYSLLTKYLNLAVCVWKRAQILVADTWAAFYPDPSVTTTHPLFPGESGERIHDLTMFADYRVPQILHHLRILTYPESLVTMLREGRSLEPGSREEVSLRVASIVSVERVREEILRVVKDRTSSQSPGPGKSNAGEVSSVLIDFFLWDLAKRIEGGEEKIEGIETSGILPAHRTRSIWY